MMQEKLTTLDELVHSEPTKQMERDGIRMCSSPVAVRHATVFTGACLTGTLQVFSNMVHEKVKHLKGVLPQWEACVAGDTFNETLAVKICRGKSTSVRAKHNDLHEALRAVAQCAARLEVTPKLKEHKVTADSIAVALDALPRAQTAAVVCQGIEVEQKFDRRSSTGSGIFRQAQEGSRPQVSS